MLTSDNSFAHPSDEVFSCISDKHPEPPADLRDFLPPSDDAAPLIATEADVMRAINSFPPSSSAGLDGIRPAHLRCLVARSASEAGARLLTALTKLTNLALSGHIPDFAAEAFYGASLIALRKKDGGLRPIAIGSAVSPPRLLSPVCPHTSARSFGQLNSEWPRVPDVKQLFTQSEASSRPPLSRTSRMSL